MQKLGSAAVESALFAGLSLISAIVSLEADHIESAGKSFAECIGEFALCGDVFRRLQVEYGGRGRHARPDVTQEIDPQYDVQSENESQIAYDGRDHEANVCNQVNDEERKDQQEPADDFPVKAIQVDRR